MERILAKRSPAHWRDTLAGNKATVGAVEVLDLELAAIESNGEVFAADHRVGQLKVAMLKPSYLELLCSRRLGGGRCRAHQEALKGHLVQTELENARSMSLHSLEALTVQEGTVGAFLILKKVEFGDRGGRDAEVKTRDTGLLQHHIVVMR